MIKELSSKVFTHGEYLVRETIFETDKGRQICWMRVLKETDGWELMEIEGHANPIANYKYLPLDPSIPSYVSVEDNARKAVRLQFDSYWRDPASFNLPIQHSLMSLPLVAPNDYGIRPAGRPDECFYCQQRVGQPHGPECVMVVKRVKVRYTFEIEVDVPHCWTKEDFEFHRNESWYCSDGMLDDIEEYRQSIKTVACLCQYANAEFIEVVDDTPRRDEGPKPCSTDEGS